MQESFTTPAMLTPFDSRISTALGPDTEANTDRRAEEAANCMEQQVTAPPQGEEDPEKAN